MSKRLVCYKDHHDQVRLEEVSSWYEVKTLEIKNNRKVEFVLTFKNDSGGGYKVYWRDDIDYIGWDALLRSSKAE